jgi:DegV family protein with EDD domain
MPAITVITDTDSSLPNDFAEKHGIQQVSINIHFEEETFRSNVDIHDDELVARIDREGRMPTTSAPTPGQFVDAYQAAFDAGAEAVICFCVSAVISATYSAALTACDQFPGRDITVVDTNSLSLGQGFVALTAAEAVAAGASKEEVLALAQDVGERATLYAALNTLKYLAMSGRVKSIQAGMGDLLSVKPILTIREGTLDLLERVRTRKKAWARVVELAAQAAGDRPVERMGIVHVAALDQARRFEEQLRAGMDCPDEILIAGLSAGLSTYGGAGMVGVALVRGKD